MLYPSKQQKIPIKGTEGGKSYLPIYAQPTAGYIAYEPHIVQTDGAFILDGSDLSVRKLFATTMTYGFRFCTLYTDTAMKGRVLAGHASMTGVQILAFAPDKNGVLRKISTAKMPSRRPRIFGGTTLTASSVGQLDLYELNIESLDLLSSKGCAPKSLSRNFGTSTTVMPLSSRTQLTYCPNDIDPVVSLNVIDYRDDKPGKSALIVSSHQFLTRDRYSISVQGFKAASRAFLETRGCFWTVDQGCMRLTSLNDSYGNDDIFTFSDILPIIGTSRQGRVSLFDVRRETRTTSFPFASFSCVKSLFVDGMPQLVFFETQKDTPMQILL